MFNDIFSFNGRIRRKEFVITLVVAIFVELLCLLLLSFEEFTQLALGWILLTAVAWLQLAQGAKRCHDINKSGWYQFIPFFLLWMAFQVGKKGTNRFGRDPK